MLSALKKMFAPKSEPAASKQRARNRCRPQLEPLEDRLTPITGVTTLAGGLTPNDLVDNLTGPNVPVSNISYTGADVAAGIFTGGSGTIGLESGVILSTGDASDVVGSPNGNNDIDTNNGTPGDPDLDAIVAPNTTNDAAVLEFDFVATGTVLVFQYVFGSDEYNDFVNAGFNDVFAFFLNGQNVALIPGTNTPVSINTVNQMTNSQFFVDNEPPNANVAVALDGFTVVLSVVLPVQEGSTNRIKLAIADVGDSAVDSVVMVGMDSFDLRDPGTYRPLRYIFDPPQPFAGADPNITPADGTFSGNITLIDFGLSVPGPIFIILPQLPAGVQVLNPTGFTSTGDPFIAVPNGPVGLQPLSSVRIPIILSNPLGNPLSTFFLDYPILITGILP